MNTKQRCKMMINGKRCGNPEFKDGLCEQHYKDRSFTTAGGAIVGAGLAGALALGPFGVIAAGVVGGVLGLMSSDPKGQGRK